MTLGAIKDLLVAVDPNIKHYFSMGNGEDYSWWEESEPLPHTANNRHPDLDMGWRFYVHRFTRTEGDPVALAFFEALDDNPATAVRWNIDFENDTGYIHHIFTCEAV